MKASKKAIIDFMPLLDVVLILLFAFIMINTSNLETVKSDIENKNHEVQALNDELTSLEKENAELAESLAVAEEALEALEYIYEEQKKSYNQLNDGLSRFINADIDEIQEMARESGSIINIETIEEFTDSKQIASALIEYEAVSKQFYFIDVELKGSENRIYINNEPTSKAINDNILRDDEMMNDKIDEIVSLIEAELSSRQGGSAMTFVTLKVYDNEVYQYAWKIVWDSIGEIQKKYGTDKIFRSSVTLID